MCAVFTVISTQRHQYTQSPCWFILERHKFCGHRRPCTRVNQTVQFINVKQVKCQRTGRENTRTQARPKKKQKKGKTQRRKGKKKENNAKQTTGVLKDVKMQEDRKGKAAIARRTPYVLERNRYLLHGQNYTKKITAAAWTKQHEEYNRCCTDKTTRLQ